MTLLRAIASLLLASIGVMGAVRAHASTTPAVVGRWHIETATSTSTTNGIATDNIGKGMLNITQTPSGLVATIFWLDERGQFTATRTFDGNASGAGAVFRHGSRRVTTGRDGKDVSVDVNVSWTLQATGDVLRGQRLIETDEDEPKPVTGKRLDPATPLPLAAAGQDKPAERGPSTPAEHARVVQMALDAEKDPQQIQARDGAWLNTWVNEIPDLTYNNGALANWLKVAAKAEIRDAIRFQYKASVMAFQVKHPAQAEQQSANDLAGMEGVLRAYEVLIRKDATYRSAKLDQALAARSQGELVAFLSTLSGKDKN